MKIPGKLLARLFALILVTACVVAFLYPVYASNFAVPASVVHQIPERIKDLQPGMTHSQVWHALGLDGYGPVRQGSGPAKDYRRGYLLRRGYGLLLVYDETYKPARFKRAKLSGANWSKVAR